MEILTTKARFVAGEPNAGLTANVSPGPVSWQQHLKAAVRSRSELISRLNLSENPTEDMHLPVIRAVESFPLFVPLPYLSRIRPGDPNDPLLLQVLPKIEEDAAVVGFVHDPLGESTATRGPGVLQKYDGRVLLVTTGACAVNCRYCFRRHFPYDESPKSPAQWSLAIQQIANDESIEEVILSGGDPLTLVDESLAALIAEIDKIPHVRRLRIHTRLPIMIPTRITDRLMETLASLRMQPIIVIHANHANEIDLAVESALVKLASGGIMLLNQSVLLRGINNNVEALVQLSQRLLACRVMPYYLHKNDPIAGTSHFEVSIERGIELINEMRTKLPGYAVPRFVQEIAGQPNKTVLA